MENVENNNMEEKKAVGFAEKHPKMAVAVKNFGKGFIKALPYILTSALSFGAGVIVGMMAGNNDSETDSTIDPIDDDDDNDVSDDGVDAV